LDESWGDDGWFRFPNAFIRDKRLTWNARAIAAWMASHDPSFAISVGTIIAAGPLGRDGVYAALRCLKDHGYLHEHQERNADGTLGSVIYQLFPRPRAEQPRTENPEAEPTSENGTSPQVAPLTGQPYTAQPTHKKTKGPKKIKKTPSPLPPVPPAAGGTDEDQEGEIASLEQSTHDHRGTSGQATPRGAEPVSDDALAVVDGAVWPLGKPRPTPVDRQRLAAAADTCVAAGHTLVDVRRELAAAVDAQRPVGAAITRLRQLAGTTPLAARAAARPRPTADADSRPSGELAQPERHTYRDGGPNGACAVCGRSQPASVHLAAPRATARCPHGRVPVACPTCRADLTARGTDARHAGNGA
jgi:hypothetical protein